MKYQDLILYSNGLKWNKKDIKETWNMDEDYLSMGVADMDFPFSPAIVTNINHRLEKSLGYTNLDPQYYDAIINWHLKTLNYALDKNHILPGFGCLNLIATVLQLFTTPQDKILVQVPVYGGFKKVILNNNRIVISNVLIIKDDKVQIDFNDLEIKMRDEQVKIFLFCNPHNPTGNIWSATDIKKIIDLCVQYNVMLISDEVWRDFVLFKNPTISVLNYIEYNRAIKNNLIVFNSPNKPFNTAASRSNYSIIFNSEIKDKIVQAWISNSMTLLPLFSDTILISCYEQGEQWMTNIKQQVENNILQVTAAIRSNFPKIKFLIPQATYLLWLNFKEFKVSNETLKDLFLKERVILVFGEFFIDNYQYCIRVNLACHQDVVDEFLIRLKKIYIKLEQLNL